ncbi:alpha/beta fold hydrolase [Ilumatobacter sp.]|uniref:alpha/beta fold hydrolase n=1 Tax=Ilumatobacter sp. TaxID=1967498 RepID=UPI003B521BB0
MDIILIAGLWMPATVWADTVEALDRLGHRPIPLELPGVDDATPSVTLDDQLDAALDAVDAATQPLVVGHSAAATLAWLVADRRPTAISGAVLIGGFPAASGSSYAAFFDIVDGAMAFPGWEPFEGPDAADLDERMRQRLAELAVAVPADVANGHVAYGDDRRFSVPLTVVCPEFTPADVRGWVSAGDVPELDRVERLDLVDIDSGHWPMITQPDNLAQLIADAAEDAQSIDRGDGG